MCPVMHLIAMVMLLDVALVRDRFSHELARV